MYHLVVCGGTFDHLHEGHKAFLRFAWSKSSHVLIGMTSDIYVRQHKNSGFAIQSYNERKKAIEHFLSAEHVLNRVTITEIDSVFYPKIWETLPIEAIIVTPDTQLGGEVINADRKRKGLPVLPIIVMPLITSKIGSSISSTTIRQGLIDSSGNKFIDPVWFSETLILPESERKWFSKPFGKLLHDIPHAATIDPDHTITVGDVVTADFNQRNIGQKISVVDYKIQRKNTYAHLPDLGFRGNETVFTAENPAGHVTPSLFTAVTDALKHSMMEKERIIISVDGEEDLAVLPLILLAPLAFVLFYGQPHEGIVRIDITQTIKQRTKRLVEKFTHLTRGY